jgi:hypothetical protein
MILNSLFLPIRCFPFSFLNSASMHPRTVPKWVSGHSSSRRHHRSCANFHIECSASELSHSKRMCSIDSVSPHRLHFPLCAEFGMVSQNSPILYVPWRHFQRYPRIPFGISLSLIDFHTWVGVGVDPHISRTACWVLAILMIVLRRFLGLVRVFWIPW